jgi:hypothetical protein
MAIRFVGVEPKRQSSPRYTPSAAVTGAIKVGQTTGERRPHLAARLGM